MRRHRAVLAPGIGERDVAEGEFAADGAREPRGLGRRHDARLDRHDLADARRRSRRLRHLVPHFRQLAERAGGEHGEEDELRQRAAGHAPGDHVLGAEPEHDDDAAEREEQRRRGDEGAGLDHRPRRLIGAVGGLAIAAGGEGFGDE